MNDFDYIHVCWCFNNNMLESTNHDNLTDFSDCEILEEEEYQSVLQKQEPRRSSLEENFGKAVAPADKKMLYRRSHSLAEIRPTHVFLPEGTYII